ncbi:trypsin-like serine protease [Photobacterium angustum]|uniref:Peptidase S1 domain-containing protein n=1 Tax=Photobacterium angustum TaxID=661 RepID=A0A2S7VYQ5_PHOAN|nr:trypsin-like serine protease [Photobacterium angustum]PQJ66724.1 hypothetical protein BTO08_04480 [Photobacterium angustum]
MISYVKSLSVLALFIFSYNASAVSPPIYPEIEKKYHVSVESFNRNTLQTTQCQGSVISPSWVLTGLKCVKGTNNSTVNITFTNSINTINITTVKKAFKFKSKKFVLLQLAAPLEDTPSVTLLRYPLLPEHGRFSVTALHDFHTNAQYSVKGKNKQTARHNTRPVEFDKNFKGGAWIIESQNLGDIQIGLTHNRQQAIQTASMARKIDRIVAENSGESVNWVDRQTLLDTLACEADGTCAEPPECPVGVQDCGLDACVLAGNCEGPTVDPECPVGVQDCGLDACVLAGNCEGPTVDPECPVGVMDCGDVCDWNDCSVPEELTVESTAYRAPYIINNDVMTIHNRLLMS